MRVHLFVPALLLVAALAGCTGGGGSAGLPPGEPCADGSCPGGDTGIQGNVLDGEGLPVGGAAVVLKETDQQTVTGQAGDFAFYGLEPGQYTVYALKLGFTQGATRVTVEEGSIESVQLVLDTIAVVEPYVDVIGPESGQFTCSVTAVILIQTCRGLAPSAFPNDKTSVAFELSSKEWQTIVGEMQWEQGTAATSNRLANFISYEGRDGSHWWCAGDGPSPIVFQYERERDSVCSDRGDQDPQPHDDEVETLVIAADSGFGSLEADNPPVRVALDQKYDLMVSIFYHEPAPPGYTALPDT